MPSFDVFFAVNQNNQLVVQLQTISEIKWVTTHTKKSVKPKYSNAFLQYAYSILTALIS